MLETFLNLKVKSIDAMLEHITLQETTQILYPFAKIHFYLP